MDNYLVKLDSDKEQFSGNTEKIPLIVHNTDLRDGSIFKFDLTSRISFTVSDEPFEEVDGNTKVWVQLNTNKEVTHVDKDLFTSGLPIIKLADIVGYNL